MTTRSIYARPLLAIMLLGGMVALAGCESHPQSSSVTTNEVTTTTPARPAMSTTTTTTRQFP